MKREMLRSFVAILTTIVLCGDLLAATAIGTAAARGPFEVDRARMEQATLFEGSTIATGSAAAEVAFNTGSRLLLAPETRGTVYRDRLLLEAGQAQLTSARPFEIETGHLRIQTTASGATARLGRSGDTVRIASLKGAFTVRNLQGRLLANIGAGDNLQMQGSPTASSTVKLTGKVSESGGKYFLTDETTKTTVELRGSQVRDLVGKRVRVDGSAEAQVSGQTQVVTVTSVHALAAGVSTMAVVAGVLVVSGAGIGLGVGLTREDPKPSASK